MIIYNTTFHIEEEALAEGLEFLQKEYLPAVSASGFMHNGKLRRVISDSEEKGHNYAVQFSVKNIDTLQYWMENEGNRIHAAMVKRFGHKIAGFSTLLEEIDWEA